MTWQRLLVQSVVILSVAAPAAAVVPPKTHLSQARVGPTCWAQSQDANEALQCWLTSHPTVASAMTYYDSTLPFSQPWSNWPAAVKAELLEHFDQMVFWYHDGPPGYPMPFPMPVPKEGEVPGFQPPAFWISEATGRAIYLSQVANSLAAELTAAFAWSIADYSSADLNLLVGMGNMISWSPSTEGASGFWFPYLGPSPAVPGYTVTFFRTNDLIGPDAATTVGRLFTWARILRHYFVAPGQPHEVFEDFWGPNTPPIPLSLIIDGSTYTGPAINPTPFSHYTAGCTGTMLFMKVALRAVNIPVQSRWVPCQHAAPIFPTIGRALTHGDDPYDSLGAVSPQPGFLTPRGTDYLVTLAYFDQLFPANIDQATCYSHVGIQVANVAIRFASDALLNRYCEDIASGASHATGKVYGYMQWYYPLQTLESTGLWTILEHKANTLNWCQPWLGVEQP